MNLCKRALLFYQLAATQINLPFKEEEVAITDPEKIAYDQLVVNLPTLVPEHIIDGINKFGNKSYFNYKPFSQELSKKLFSSFNRSIIMVFSYIKRAIKIKEDIKEKIIQDILDFNLDNSEKPLSSSEYLGIFDTYDLPEKILRKAQHKVLQYIINLNNNDKSLESMNLLNSLLTKSTKFDKALLWQLAKHFGPDYYGELSNLSHGILNPLMVPDFEEKKVLDIYDVSKWLWAFRISGQRWSKEDFIKLIAKSNEEAKQYLRNFLYAYADGSSNFFILSEDMRPMNENYQSISFPDRFYIMYGWEDVETIKEVWQPIFDDFKIIPYIIDQPPAP